MLWVIIITLEYFSSAKLVETVSLLFRLCFGLHGAILSCISSVPFAALHRHILTFGVAGAHLTSELNKYLSLI